MKKFKRFAYIFIFIIILALSFIVYKSLAKDSTTDIRDKTLSEIKYFESKIIYMCNALNSIEFENYKIYSEDITASNTSKPENESSSKEDSESSSESESQSTTEETKKYTLNSKGVLNSKEQINWDYIKKEAETLQNSISTMTLDLYEISLNNSDILNFNKEYDNFLIQIKKEDKEATLKELAVLYSYIPRFIKNCNKDEKYEIIINTKENIINAYALLDTDDWTQITKYLQSANDSYSKLLTDIRYKNKDQYTINKCYITLNNLQNCIEQKDKEIFLIKYRNLLEDFNNL